MRGLLITRARELFPDGVPDELVTYIARMDLTDADLSVFAVFNEHDEAMARAAAGGSGIRMAADVVADALGIGNAKSTGGEA